MRYIEIWLFFLPLIIIKPVLFNKRIEYTILVYSVPCLFFKLTRTTTTMLIRPNTVAEV